MKQSDTSIVSKLLLLLFLSLVGHNLFGQDSTKLINNWKLIKYDAFEKVKNSPAYRFADEEAAKKYDAMVKLLLDSVQYDFRSDNTLVYVDFENNKLVKRRATWSVDHDELLIVESDRPYSRKAKIVKLTDTELVFSPIIDGEVGNSSMTFAIATGKQK